MVVAGFKAMTKGLIAAGSEVVLSFAAYVILIVLTLIFAETIYVLDLASPMETILAFAPGGQAELTVLALIVGADMAFVIAHHVLRIFVVIFGAPLFARWFNQAPRD